MHKENGKLRLTLGPHATDFLFSEQHLQYALVGCFSNKTWAYELNNDILLSASNEYISVCVSLLKSLKF